MLESFSFTEDKRKEERDDIGERVRLLKDEDVGFSLHSDFGRPSETPYENILKGASLSDTMHFGGERSRGKSLAMSPLRYDAHFLPRILCLCDGGTDSALSSSRDWTRGAPQSHWEVLPLALHSRRDLFATSIFALPVAPCQSRAS